MELKWEEISVDVRNKNKNHSDKFVRLVDGVSGIVKSGQMHAIMGPSGGGKTTFLDAISGRVRPDSKTSGKVTPDGKPRKIGSWLERIGYVDQDDKVFDTLTIEETV
jgi:ABC-type multidrug transport system ATPase subunit